MKQKIILTLAGFILAGCGAATWGNLSQEEIGSWQSAGITVEQYSGWKKAGFTPAEAEKWNKAGITVNEAVQWKENKFTFEDTIAWKKAGKSMSEAMDARTEGLEPIN
jgi:hypothetical protein